MHAPVQHVEEPLHRRDADPRMSAREGIRPEQQHGPNDFFGKRLTHTGAMTEDEIALQFPQPVVPDEDILECPEARGDAVHDRVLAHSPLHPLA